jgi:hypothetical protein
MHIHIQVISQIYHIIGYAWAANSSCFWLVLSLDLTIELLWAQIKGNIGHRYSLGITLTDVKAHLDGEFTAAMEWNDLIAAFSVQSRYAK